MKMKSNQGHIPLPSSLLDPSTAIASQGPEAPHGGSGWVHPGCEGTGCMPLLCQPPPPKLLSFVAMPQTNYDLFPVETYHLVSPNV